MPNYSVNKSGDEQETDDDMPDLIDMSGRKKTPKSAKKECKKEPKTPDAAKRSGDEGDWIYVERSAKKEQPKTPTSVKKEQPKTPTSAKKEPPKTPTSAKREPPKTPTSAKKEPPKTPTTAKKEPPKTQDSMKKSGVAPVHQGAFCRVFI